MTRIPRTYANDPHRTGVTWVRNVHDGTALAEANARLGTAVTHEDWVATLADFKAALDDDPGVVPVPGWQMADIAVGGELAERVAG